MESILGNQFEGSFWWRAHLKLVDLFKAMTRCNLGDGKSTFFWSNLWQSSCLQQRFPHLLSFAKYTNGTTFEIVNTEFLEDLFHLPFSQQAFLDLDQFEEVCNQAILKINGGGVDSWSYIWGGHEFLVHKAYVVMSGSQPTPPHLSWI
jgi:hypothetical protein